MWSDLFVRDRLPRETTSKDPSSSPRFTAVEIDGVEEQIASEAVEGEALETSEGPALVVQVRSKFLVSKLSHFGSAYLRKLYS